jgi:hypothetical protein
MLHNNWLIPNVLYQVEENTGGNIPAKDIKVHTARKMDSTFVNLKSINVDDIERKLQLAGANFEPKWKLVKNAPEVGVKYGVEDTIDVVAVILILVKAFIEGGIKNYLAVLVRLPDAIIGIDNVDEELSDLDESEVQLITDYVITNFPSVPTAKVQVIVNHAVKALYHISEIIKIVVADSEDPEKLDKNQILVEPTKKLGTT